MTLENFTSIYSMLNFPLIEVLCTSARAGSLPLVETLCVSARVGDLPDRKLRFLPGWAVYLKKTVLTNMGKLSNMLMIITSGNHRKRRRHR